MNPIRPTESKFLVNRTLAQAFEVAQSLVLVHVLVENVGQVRKSIYPEKKDRTRSSGADTGEKGMNLRLTSTIKVAEFGDWREGGN